MDFRAVANRLAAWAALFAVASVTVPLCANAQEPGGDTEESAWNQAASKNAIEAYLSFATAFPKSTHIRVTTGILRGRHYETIGDPVVTSAGASAESGPSGVLVTVADTDAFALLTIDNAIGLGVVDYKMTSTLRSGTMLKVQVTTFNVSSYEVQGESLFQDKQSSNRDVVAGIVIEPKDILNTKCVLSADGKRLLAWDLNGTTVAEHADVSRATYPASARKPSGGLNPESQTATLTQKVK